MSDVYVLTMLDFYDDYKRADCDMTILGVFASENDACVEGCIAIENYLDELYNDCRISYSIMNRFDLKPLKIVDPLSDEDDSDNDEIGSDDGIPHIDDTTPVVEKFDTYCELLEKYVNIPTYTMKCGNNYQITKTKFIPSKFKF